MSDSSPIKPIKAFTINSLVNRFFVASLMVLPLFIVVSGTLLLNTFHHSQLNAEQEKLQTQLYLLLGVTEVEERTLVLPEAFTEPRFNQQNSGLYGFIFDDKHNELWRSPSAELMPNTQINIDTPFNLDSIFFTQVSMGSQHTQLNTLSYDIEWIDDNNKSQPFRFIIASDAQSLNAELDSYRSRLWQWLSAMGVGLILLQFVMMRWGLHPLKRLTQQLHLLQKNNIQKLDDNYPIEIQPVINNFNDILSQEKQQRERYRNTMSDLAHSLKTPLAVIQSQLSEQQSDNIDEHNQTLNDQVQRINEIIAHQLQRAVIRVNQSAINHNTNKIYVHKVVNRLIKIISKVYQEKDLHFTNLSNSEATFFGDEADLLEVLGNLIDNACKHGNKSVMITAENNDKQLLICISDDGKGVQQDTYKTILERGARADTAQPGQGLGLSVAVDIISSYGGGIKVVNNAESPHLSGACFCIHFEYE